MNINICQYIYVSIYNINIYIYRDNIDIYIYIYNGTLRIFFGCLMGGVCRCQVASDVQSHLGNVAMTDAIPGKTEKGHKEPP